MQDLLLRVWVAFCTLTDRNEHGQTTTEYALVMIAAAAVAGLVLTWATKTHSISKLFDVVLDKILPG